MPGWLGWTVRTGAGGAPATPVPTLIQHVASSANPAGVGISGNNFKGPIPNAVGAGNCLVLGFSYPNGNTPTITDNNGNAWPGSPSVSADNGVGGYVAAIFVLPNANAGLTTLNFAFGASVIPFNYTISEINAIATVSPVNGTHGAAGVAAPNLAAGSFTPGNNDANGGNAIWSYFAPSGGINSNPTGWASGSGFTLLDGDIAWNTNQGFPHASEWQVQAAAGAINPSITATGDTTDSFNCVAVALKAANAGTAIPAGIHVNKLIHQTSNAPPANSTWTIHLPCTGNLRVITANENSPVINIIGIIDSDGLAWTKIEPSTDEPQIWYRANTSPNANLKVTLTISGSPATASLRCYDIQGAAVSPIGASAGITPPVNLNGQSTITNHPSITPQAAGSLIITRGNLGQGPGLSVTSPAGAVFVLTTYSTETDTDLMENADLEAIYYTTSTSAIHFDWTITSQASNSGGALAVEFKAA